MGPRTGRGLGRCAGGPAEPVDQGYGYGRGGGRGPCGGGRAWGRGRGRGGGWGMGYGPVQDQPQPMEADPRAEVDMLRQRLAQLEATLAGQSQPIEES